MSYKLMPKAEFKLSDFLSEVSSRGMAKANRFEVVINPPLCVTNLSVNSKPSQDQTGGRYQTQKSLGARVPARVSLFCEQAQLPGTRIITSRQQIFGPPSLHPIAAEYGGENISLTFMLDKWYTIKEFFDTWIDGVVNRETGVSYYQENYLSEMTIAQLDEDDQVHYMAKFEDVYPIAVNPVQLDANMNNTVSRLTVSFAYRRWRSLTLTPASSNAESAETPQPASATPPSRQTSKKTNSQNRISRKIPTPLK
jgi:hypothetical protein